MPSKSLYPDLDNPQVNLLTYLFPPGSTPSNEPIWIDSKEPEKSLSPKQLLQQAKRLAFGLEKLNIASGEVIMIYSPNHIYVPVSYLAVIGAGFAFSAANPVYTVSEMVHQIDNTTARVILAHPTMLKRAIAAAAKSGFPKDRIFQFSDYEEATFSSIKDWRTIMGSVEEGDQYAWRKFTPQQSLNTVATINYSSGTTGLPKGVCVSHYNLVANAEQAIFMKYLHKSFDFKNRPLERWIGFLPLYHAYGQLYTIIIATKLQIPVFVMKQFIYKDFLACIQKFKVTHLQVAPPILIMLDKRSETADYNISSLTDILCGAAPLSKELQNNVSARFHVQINQDFLMMMEGQPGELYIRGPNVCLRYWNNEAATKQLISPDNWLRTGGIAVYDEKGYFWIVDRKKELIKVNGLQVAPAELEAVLLEHEHVADAAVVGITIHDEEWPRAYIVLQDIAQGKTKPADIEEWIKHRVAKHKWLVGGVTFVHEMPKLASGKIQRKKMREWAKADTAILKRKTRLRI